MNNLVKLITALVLIACPAWGSQDERVSLLEAQGRYQIEGSFQATAPIAEVWAVLTDYEGLRGVVSSITASSVISREGNIALVRQDAAGHFFIFNRDVRLLLKIEEFPTARLLFEDISAATFPTYRGSWTLEATPTGVQVHYQLEVTRAALGPAWIEKSLFRDNALTLLRELKTEIQRRAETRVAALHGGAQH